MGGRSISLVIKSLKEGNKDALEYLYKRHYSKLYGFAGRFRLGHVSSDDIVQQTFLRIWENRGLLKDDVPFEKQLYTIGKNIILNHIKKEKPNISLDDLKIMDRPPEKGSDNVPEKEEMLKRVYEKIGEMPARRREIFELYRFHGLSYLEISKKLKISKNTVANHLQMAISFLRKEL